MRLIFRPIRSILLIGTTFLAGVAYEKYNHSDRCLAAGGHINFGLCEGSRP